jgi:hypothetical protein
MKQSLLALALALGLACGFPSSGAGAARALTPEQKKKADDEIDGWLKKGPPAPPAKEPL